MLRSRTFIARTLGAMKGFEQKSSMMSAGILKVFHSLLGAEENRMGENDEDEGSEKALSTHSRGVLVVAGPQSGKG